MIGTTVVAGTEVSESFRSAFGEHGVFLTEEDIVEVRGRSKSEAIADLVAKHLPQQDRARTVASIHGAFRHLLLDRYEDSAGPTDGAREVVATFQRRAIPVVLTTGLDRVITDAIIRGMGWATIGLAAVLSGDDVASGRPAPDLIHLAMGVAGVADSKAVLVVGDTVADLESAIRADVGWSIGVLGGAHSRTRLESVPHSAILGGISELPEWLERIGVWTP